MFQNKTDYDRGVNTFSPEGRLFQVEYALQAIKLGASALAIKVNEGVVLAGERKLNSTLLEPKSIEKIYEIDTHVACTASGFIPDARTLVEHARVESQNHKFNYGESINVRALTQIVCDLALDFGESDSKNKTRMSRPYGVALLIAGVSDQGPQIYQTDPTGTMIEYQAKGIGAADEGIQSILKEQYKQDLTLEQAERLAILCLKNVMEEKINNKNVELAVITTVEKRFTQRTPEQIQNLIDKV
ncbi:unnamed protein product [Paramecium primaurelia]|uniref:Proteasome subunit alpha type n=1 Tax=Paramecium primaurelia TaxID=5886 RepID=A0A8S1QD81_PARPR|nr:unnamed protein product [Paramecium primaurelia]